MLFHSGNELTAFTFQWPGKPKSDISIQPKRVYAIYTLGGNDVVLKDADVAKLKNGAEIEVIFV